VHCLSVLFTGKVRLPGHRQQGSGCTFEGKDGNSACQAPVASALGDTLCPLKFVQLLGVSSVSWRLNTLRGLSPEPRTQAYVARRTSKGLSRKEIQRYLKRYIVRELYPLILADLRH